MARGCVNPLFCKKCKRRGHTTKDCNAQSVASTMATITSPSVTLTTHSGMEPSVSAVGSGNQLRLAPGLVSDRPVSVLRDSGATIIGVHKDYVLDSDFTGGKVPCYQFSGAVEDMPTAQINIDTPYLSGKVEALVGAFPGADLIIGNVPGVLTPSDEDISKWKEAHSVQLGAVQTKAMASRGEPKPLKVKSVPLGTTTEEFKVLQREDLSLKLCFQDAETGKEKAFKFSSACYFVKDGLLYRKYKRGSQIQNQLVIPSPLVPSALKLAHDVPPISPSKQWNVRKVKWDSEDNALQGYRGTS
ncbi:reverse transcriptase [Plakobranchus ocellatus]|uniref:Reverse transcriptase n=1 Tax=Plakobranchus ocellatus TaxID=259542 RepID=A0AAV4CK58_9GAST|nr:reverse transcriptase [Plakobranchus ocellatus]